MDTSSDTSPKKKPYKFLFPRKLLGKKLKTYDTGYPHINEKNKQWETLLEQYLTTMDPDFLIEAARKNPKLLEGRAQYLMEKRESQIHPVSKYVEPYWETIIIFDRIKIRRYWIKVGPETVVWESINWWIQYHNYCGASQKVEIVKRYLSAIGAADRG